MKMIAVTGALLIFLSFVGAAQQPTESAAAVTARIAPSVEIGGEGQAGAVQVVQGITAIINLLTAIVVTGEAGDDAMAQLNAAARDLDTRLEDVEGDVDDIRRRMILVSEQLNRMDERLNEILRRLP